MPFEKPAQPEAFHLPETQRKLAEFRGDLEELEERVEIGLDGLKQARERIEHETRRLEGLQRWLDRLKAGVETGDMTIAEEAVEDGKTYLAAAELDLASYQRVTQGLMDVRRDVERTVERLLEADRDAGAEGAPPRPRNQA